MSHRIDFLQLFSANNADCLAGSALDPMPAAGFARVYATEILASGTIEIAPSLHPSPTGTGPQQVMEGGSGDTAANHPVIKQYDPHWETEVEKGEKLTIRLAGTTTECLLWVSFMAAGK